MSSKQKIVTIGDDVNKFQPSYTTRENTCNTGQQLWKAVW